METATQIQGRGNGFLVRVSGVAWLVAFTIHIVANFFIKEWPPDNPSPDELQAYFVAEGPSWQVVHGLRYLAVAGLAMFYAGAFARVRSVPDSPTGGWEILGLLGGGMHVTNLLIANGLETLAFLDYAWLSERPELFWLVFHSTRILFTAEIAIWGIAITGFSLAGWRSRTIPRWIGTVGLVSSALAIVSAVFLGKLMTTGGWVGVTADIATISGLIWFVSVGIVMLRRGVS